MDLEAVETTDKGASLTCDKCNCIVVYNTNHCPFCDMAYEMVVHMFQQYGITEGNIYKIDVEKGCTCHCTDTIRGVPAIRICEELIVGLPDKEQLHDAVIRILMKDCLRA